MSWIDELGLRHFDEGGESYSNEGRNYTTPSYSDTTSDYSNEGRNYTEPSAPTPAPAPTPTPATVSTANENVFDPGGTWNSGGLQNNTAAPTAADYTTSGGADFLGGMQTREPTIADYYDVLGAPAPAPAGDTTRRALYGDVGYGPSNAPAPMPYGGTGSDMFNRSYGTDRLNQIYKDTLRDDSGSALTDRYGVPILTGQAAQDMLSGKISYGTVPYIYDQQSKQMVPNPGYHQWNEGDKYNGQPGYFDAKGKWQYGVAQNGMKYEDLKKYAEIAPNKGQTLIADNQTIDQAIATMEFEKQLNTTVLPMFKGVVMSQLGPGASFAFNTLQQLGDVAAGKTTVGNVVTGALLNIGSTALGIKPGTAQAILNMDWGQAAANEVGGRVISKAVQSIAEASGMPPQLVNQLLQQTGVGKSVHSALADVVNQVIPGDPQNNVGFVAKILDNAMGTTAPSSGNVPSNYTITGEPSYSGSSGSNYSGSIGSSGNVGQMGVGAPTVPTPKAQTKDDSGLAALLAALGAGSSGGVGRRNVDRGARIATRSPFGSVFDRR